MMPSRLFAAIMVVSLTCAAQAQQEFRLDEPGQWVAMPARPLSPDEQVIQRAREALADDRPGEAIRVLDPWIEEHKASEHPLLAQAYLLRGDAITSDGNEFKALYDYEAVIVGFPATEEYRRAIERELEIAIKYVNGLKRKWLGMRFVDAEDIGMELLTRVAERLPGDELAERAIMELVEYYYRTRDLPMTAEACETFLANFPKSAYANKARQRRIFANIARFKGPDYDASGLTEAKVLIEDFVRTDPVGAQQAGLSDAMIAKLDESAAAQILQKSRWYLTRNDPVSARYNLRRLIAKHPQTVAARTALQMLNERGWALVPGDEVLEPERSSPEAGNKP
jgi:hypothetical protein